MNACKIVVEAQMTNPPKPTNFGVLLNGQAIGWLHFEELKRAVDQYEAMLKTHKGAI